jgi:hypothetical protein
MMTHGSNAVELVDRKADERLLGEDLANLPDAVGRPEAIPPSRTRSRLVGVGATLTGITLLTGIGLLVLGVVEVLSSGFGALAIAALAVGLLFVGTHWGWVHVAEATADTIEGRRNGEVIDRRRLWLATIEPYARYEVTTDVGDDGSITIISVAHRPVPSGEHGFTFVREVVEREVHSGEESAAVVAERAELLRRQAAHETERERERFEIASDAYETALLGRSDEQQRIAALHAASEALSQQINSNLRDPPLVE